MPAAKKGDTVVGVDTHVLLVPSPGGPVPTPTPMPFNGSLSGDLSPDVVVDNQPMAVDGSTADNSPAHIPTAGPFQSPPANKAKLQASSSTVIAGNKPVARITDSAMTCNDPGDAPNGVVMGNSTVIVGD
jgi:uncharacterized Zn-binding protein involved in type VI secretion